MTTKRTCSSAEDWTAKTERFAACAIGTARSLADTLAREAPKIGVGREAELARMLHRFRQNNPFDHEDDEVFATVGEALADAVDAIAPGYSKAILYGNTEEHWILNDRLAELRGLLLRWDALNFYRGHVQAHVAARRFLAGPSR